MSDKAKHRRSIVKARIGDDELSRLASIPETVERVGRFLSILKLFGIAEALERLEHPDATPEACMKGAQRQLDVMAHHGDKWLYEDWLDRELTRLRSKGGSVRFLLSDSASQKTKERCQDLKSKYQDAFDARFFAGRALFRAIFIDTNRLLLSHYGIEVIEQDWNNTKGWLSPQLRIDDNDQWSLLIPFRALFRSTWDGAPPLDRLPPASSTTVERRAFHPER